MVNKEKQRKMERREKGSRTDRDRAEEAQPGFVGFALCSLRLIEAA